MRSEAIFKKHDVVALTQNRNTEQLHVGDLGAVVHCYKRGKTYEVEFLAGQGQHKAVAAIPATQLMRLNLLSLTARATTERFANMDDAHLHQRNTWKDRFSHERRSR
ncbi:MAG: DUF4926 domain-containing protein [Phycisphaerales bacterium]|nr:DUF4926 domain-containing protein [Phycisphaerales bacterium]